MPDCAPGHNPILLILSNKGQDVGLRLTIATRSAAQPQPNGRGKMKAHVNKPGALPRRAARGDFAAIGGGAFR